MITSQPISAETEIIFTKAKFDIAYFASLMFNGSFNPEWTQLIRRLGPQNIDVHARTFTMSPRQFGLTTALAIAAAHYAIFSSDNKKIVVLTDRFGPRVDTQDKIKTLIVKFLEIIIGNNEPNILRRYTSKIMQSILFISRSTTLNGLRGFSPSVIFLDDCMSCNAQVLADIGMSARCLPHTKFHIFNTSYHECFNHSAFDKFEKYHIKDSWNSKLYRSFCDFAGKDAAVREIMCLDPQLNHPTTSVGS